MEIEAPAGTVRLALFLGAGFSKWAADLPLGAELFDFRIASCGVREARKLETVKLLKETWDREHPKGLPEQFISDALSFKPEARAVVLWYVVRRLCEPFIWQELHAQRWRRHVLMIDEYRRDSTPGVVSARAFLGTLRGRMRGIITSNYDLLAEYALGTTGFNYGRADEVLLGRGPYPVSSWRNPVRLTGDLPPAKLHGSISWDHQGFYTDGRCGLRGRALIVPPCPEKQVPPKLAFAWELARGILRSSRKLLVFGFGFNRYDGQLLDFLGVNGESLQEVLLVDPASKQDLAGILWPKAEILCCPPPPAGAEEITRWACNRP